MKTTHEISHSELNEMVHEWVKAKGLVPKGKRSLVRLNAQITNPGGSPYQFSITANVVIEDEPPFHDPRD
jgi:hypothetical protein